LTKFRHRFSANKNDRDSFCRCAGGKARSASPACDNHGCLVAYQFTRQTRQPIVSTSRPPVLNSHIPPHDIAALLQAIEKCSAERARRFQRPRGRDNRSPTSPIAARAANAHIADVTPTNVMNSRRLMRFSRNPGPHRVRLDHSIFQPRTVLRPTPGNRPRSGCSDSIRTGHLSLPYWRFRSGRATPERAGAQAHRSDLIPSSRAGPAGMMAQSL